LTALGSPAQKRAWLPAIARGEKRVTLAVAEEGASADPAAFATVVRRRGSTLRLAGEKRYVLQGVTADAFLVAARDGRGASAVLVPADAPGVRVEPQKTFGKDRQSIVRLQDVALPRGALAGRPGAAWPRFTALRTRLAALVCADMIGGTDAVLEMTTRYVCEREQFGVKLGTFQAVQQMVAVMAIELEGARHVTRQALWRLAAGLLDRRSPPPVADRRRARLPLVLGLGPPLLGVGPLRPGEAGLRGGGDHGRARLGDQAGAGRLPGLLRLLPARRAAREGGGHHRPPERRALRARHRRGIERDRGACLRHPVPVDQGAARPVGGDGEDPARPLRRRARHARGPAAPPRGR